MTTKKTNNQLLSRRETLRLIGAAGGAALVGWGDRQSLGLWPSGQTGSAVEASSLANAVRPALFAPAPRLTKDVSQITCVARPALTEGPFFVDELLNRSDIRSDPSNGAVKPGALLKLKFNVYRVGGSACTPARRTTCRSIQSSPTAMIFTWRPARRS